MSWGHAVSPDLVTWSELPVALEHTDDELVFSGSVVVDHRNTSGLGTGQRAAMVAVYTAADPVTGLQTQALAYSTDRGRTWTRHAGNPVLDIGSADFRDPKVFWYEPSGHWLMAIALSADRRIRFYRSDDLHAWDQLSDFGPAGAVDGVWECPDLFELPIDDDPLNTRWVLVVSLNPGGIAGGSGTQYFVGHFDGQTFVPDHCDAPASWLDFGADYYAATSFTDPPDGERILIGWMSNWAYAARTPQRAFRGSMSIPRTHRLATIDGRIELVQAPVGGLAALRGSSYTLQDVIIRDRTIRLPEEAHGRRLEITAEFEPGSAKRLGLHVRARDPAHTVVGYDTTTGEVYVDRRNSGDESFDATFGGIHSAPLSLRRGCVSLTVLVDDASVEVFAGAGERTITDQIFPALDGIGTALFADGGTARLVSLSVTPLSQEHDHLSRRQVSGSRGRAASCSAHIEADQA